MRTKQSNAAVHQATETPAASDATEHGSDKDLASPGRNRLRPGWRRALTSPEGLVFIFMLVLGAALEIGQPLFLTEANLQDVGTQSAVLLVLSGGLLFVLILGGIDLSVGGMIGFSGVVAADLSASMSPGAAFAIAIGACAVIGVVNGVLIGILDFSPIIVTLAVGQLITGVALLMTVAGPIEPANPHYSDLATLNVGPVPELVIAAVVCLVVAHIILSRTRLGNYIYAVGGNETGAWLAGLPVPLVKIAAYSLCALFAGAAGVLASTRIGSGDPSVGPPEMLEGFAAVFLGGVGFGTGRGKVVGVALGALILGMIGNGLDLYQLDSDWKYIVSGVLIILAIAVQVLPGKLGRSRP